jgi:deoxyribodipyrimidine photo-lyase
VSSILRGLKHDRRVDFIWQGLKQIDDQLRQSGGGLIVRFGKPTECIPQIAKELGVQTVFTNHDYEPSAIDRDETVKSQLSKLGIEFETFKDQVIFEKKEILTNSNTVFFSLYTLQK